MINTFFRNVISQPALKCCFGVKVDGVEYAIYYVACKAGDTIKAPKDLKNTTISGTNEGGVIVTVKLSK